MQDANTTTAPPPSFMSAERKRSRLWHIAPFFVLALFYVDMWLPMVISIPVCYMAALVLIILSPNGRDKAILAALCTVLTVVAYISSLTRPGVIPWVQIITHCFAVSMLWVVTALEFRHRSAQKELRDSEERYRTLYHGTPSMYFSVDRSGMVLSVNDFGAAQLGYRPGDLIGRSVFDIFLQEDRSTVTAQFAEAFEYPGKLTQWEFRKLRKDGSLLWVREWVRIVNNDTGQLQALIVCEDVTERKQTEDALRQSEQLANERLAQLKSVYASAPVALAFVDCDLRYVSVNDALAAMNGCSPEQHIGRTIREILPRLAAAVEPRYRRAIDSGEPVLDVEVRGHTPVKPGGLRHWLSSYYPVKDDTGRVLGVNVAVRDVTQRKQSEQDALFMLDVGECIRLATDADELPWAVVVALGEHLNVDRAGFAEVDSDQDGLIVQRDYHRYERSLTGTYGLNLFGPEVVSQARAGHSVVVNDVQADPRTASRAEKYRALGVGSYIVAPLVSNGRWVSSLIAASQRAREWRESEVNLVMAVAERTWLAVERLRLDAALRQSEAQLRRLVAILEQTTDFVGTADTSARATYLNRAGRKMIGISEFADITGITIADYHPPWAARIVTDEGVPHAIAYGVWRGETALLAADGTELRVSQLILSHRDAAGKVEYLSTVARDITEHKQLEAALREADRRKDEFLATLAHELRNPLALIRNVVELLQRRGLSAVELQRGHRIVEKQADYLTRMTDDLFDVSRITQEKIELRKERVELGEILKTAIETCRTQIDEQGHQLSVDLNGTPVYIDGDKMRLTQVFMNLLHNAAKYTPRGGSIWVAQQHSDGGVVVSVRDNGAGIPAQSLPHLFDMFYQVDRSHLQAEGGLGLGLTLVRRLVEMHGGRVEAKSAGINRGSEFVVRLPVLSPTCAPPPPGQSAARTKLPQLGQRILIADDFPESATTLAKLLEESGNQVETANDGLEAVEAAERFHPDIAVLDIAMPRLNGYEAARRIRAQPWGKNMILIAFTGWGQSRDRDRSREAGFDMHLTKPVKYDVLLQLLQKLALERRSSSSAETF